SISAQDYRQTCISSVPPKGLLAAGPLVLLPSPGLLPPSRGPLRSLVLPCKCLRAAGIWFPPGNVRGPLELSH
ncbi:MAG: hypothetical protein ACK53Y_24910, partial [bacterium]